MSAAFGSPTGILYPLGPIVVAAAGTAVPLSQNVAITTAFGTGTSQAPICATQLILSTPIGNTGVMYLCLGATGKGSVGNSVVLTLAPGENYTLSSPQLSNPFLLNQFVVDATTSGNSMYITAVIV